MSSVLPLYRKLSRKPLGQWLFSQLVCWKAPYFASIRPRLLQLEPGRGEATIAHRRNVTNHIGTVHAIALCNLPEFVGLPMSVAFVGWAPWCPRGSRNFAWAQNRAHPTCLPVNVIVTDPKHDTVFKARIAMWVSPKSPAR